jgi:hypothetical protein
MYEEEEAYNSIDPHLHPFGWRLSADKVKGLDVAFLCAREIISDDKEFDRIEEIKRKPL